MQQGAVGVHAVSGGKPWECGRSCPRGPKEAELHTSVKGEEVRPDGRGQWQGEPSNLWGQYSQRPTARSPPEGMGSAADPSSWRTGQKAGVVRAKAGLKEGTLLMGVSRTVLGARRLFPISHRATWKHLTPGSHMLRARGNMADSRALSQSGTHYPALTPVLVPYSPAGLITP